MYKQTRRFYFFVMLLLLACIVVSSSAMGQHPRTPQQELIPPSSDPLTSSSSPQVPGELIPPSRGRPQHEMQPEERPRIIHRTFTVHEVVIRKNKELNQSYCVPKGYVVFQYSHVLHKRSRYTKFRITHDPLHRECIRLIATLESSSKKLFGFFLKQPTAKLHLKIHVAAKISSPSAPPRQVQPNPPSRQKPTVPTPHHTPLSHNNMGPE